MNMFVLDAQPHLCATYHCDKHIVKMPLETAQVLCTVLHQSGVNAPYRPTHRNHPLVKWAGASIQNFTYLVDLGFELCCEYTYRYEKRHACQNIIEDSVAHLSALRYLPYHMTDIPQCMPDYCKVPNNPVQAYRNYYIQEKRGIATWNKKRPTPSWYTVKN